MIQDVQLPGMYRGKVNLWVEDATTRSYFRECWANDPDIFFLTAGGNEGVHAILKDAQERGYGNVFGFRDRDFGPSNCIDWGNTQKAFRCFVPTVHEVENYLLDEVALAGCVLNTAHRTPAEINRRLEKRAGELVWWMACRTVIAGLRTDFTDDFPEHPKCPAVTDLASASNFITSQVWYKDLGGRAAGATAAGEIDRRLANAHVERQTELSSGAWKQTFSGRELFHHVRDWVYEARPANASTPEMDVDLAKAIAAWQVQNNNVPQEVRELRASLRQRAGLPL